MDKVGLPNEGLLTFAACVGPLSGVDFLMLNKYMSVAKGFSTLTALIGPLSGVISPMFH